jgi:N-hydroxyarylamine O-acetyltransferase
MTAPASPRGATAELNVAAYLERIGYRGPITPSAGTLRALHLAHLYTVPFENLDIGLGRPLSLALPALFDKIVTRRRGGFCYELNGLFAWLLTSLGYRVTPLSARVFSPDGSLGPEFDHLTLWVACPAGSDKSAGERWLADVGFGEWSLAPLLLAPSPDPPPGQGAHWLTEQGGAWEYWQRDPAGAPERQYAFTLQPRQFPADFEPMCRYQQTAPESHFTQHRVCTLATPAGRITLSDRRWIVTENGQRQERAIDDAEFGRILKADFGITLDPH